MSLMSEPIARYFWGYAIKSDPARRLCDGENTTGLHVDVTLTEQALGEIVASAFTAGARWEMRESAKLSPYISKFLEMVILLGPDPGRDEWFDLEQRARVADDFKQPEFPQTEGLTHDTSDNVPF